MRNSHVCFPFLKFIEEKYPFSVHKKRDKKEKCPFSSLSLPIVSIRDPFIEIAQQIHLANSMSYLSKNSFFSVLD